MAFVMFAGVVKKGRKAAINYAVNPTTISFTASPDHATLDHYQSRYYRTAGGEVGLVSEESLGLPTPSGGVVSASMNTSGITPSAAGRYVAYVVAVDASSNESESAVSNLFAVTA